MFVTSKISKTGVHGKTNMLLEVGTIKNVNR